MRVLSFLFAIVFVIHLLGCDFGGFDSNETPRFYHKELLKVYSPDKVKYFTINENGTDTSDAHTQVFLNFKNGGAGIYATRGINKKINAYWKGNSVIVIETFKDYDASQKWPQVQLFNDTVKIEFIEE